MQVKELSAEGLKREYQVVVEAEEIEKRVSKRLDELSRTVRMPGFRPGKVPVALLRKQYGRSVMGEVLEQALQSAYGLPQTDVRSMACLLRSRTTSTSPGCRPRQLARILAIWRGPTPSRARSAY